MSDDIVAFNVGSSSVVASRKSGETVSRTGLDVDELADAASAVASEIGVDEDTVHVHRIVHGGDLPSPKRLTGDVLEEVRRYNRFASLHNPPELAVVDAVQSVTGRTGHAVFDTSFHQTIPDHRRVYGLPTELFEEGIKQYGFHGVSVEGATAGRDGDVICCHLGSGCSVTAVQDGESVATSMGLTPFDGVIMHTRPGRLDPGVVLELCRYFETVDEVDDFLNESCGWHGMSEGESLKALVEDSPHGLVVDAFVDSVASEMQRVATGLDDVDEVIFTGGAGENNAELRRRICRAASLLDVSIDSDANRAGNTVVSEPGSSVEVRVVEADEAATMIRKVEEHRG